MSINVTRESRVKVFGRWVRVPNWVIVDRQWSTERKNRARDNAARLGAVQTFVTLAAGKAFPWFAAASVIVGLGIVGGLESR